MLRAGGRLASALGASGDQLGRDDITVAPVMATAPPDKVAAMLGSVAAGTLEVPIDRTYTLDRAAEALTDFGGHKLGKVVVAISSPWPVGRPPRGDLRGRSWGSPHDAEQQARREGCERLRRCPTASLKRHVLATRMSRRWRGNGETGVQR